MICEHFLDGALMNKKNKAEVHWIHYDFMRQIYVLKVHSLRRKTNIEITIRFIQKSFIITMHHLSYRYYSFVSSWNDASKLWFFNKHKNLKRIKKWTIFLLDIPKIKIPITRANIHFIKKKRHDEIDTNTQREKRLQEYHHLLSLTVYFY